VPLSSAVPAANQGNRSSVSNCAVRALLTKNVKLSATRKATHSRVVVCTTLSVRVEEYEAAVTADRMHGKLAKHSKAQNRTRCRGG
jgi:hypothetical protein